MVLHKKNDSGRIAVSFDFIENIMPRANGEFVKIYLYLLRLMESGSEITVSELADRLFCTENDIRRACRYWEKEHMLTIVCDEQGEILELSEGDAALPAALPAKAETASAPDGDPSPVSPAAAPVIPDKSSGTPVPEVPDFSADRLMQLQVNEDFRQILFITETYFGRPLRENEINSLSYYYDTLALPADVIEYLIETCVSGGHKSFHYIEKVAQGWHQAGVASVEDAKKQTTRYSQQYYAVLRAFGVTDRSPVDKEIKTIDHWMKDLGFSTDLICEAAGRTISSIGKISFSYAEGILKSWNRQQLHTLAQVKEADTKRAAQLPAETSQKPAPAGSKKGGSRFNNFPQRGYDFAALEKQLLDQQ